MQKEESFFNFENHSSESNSELATLKAKLAGALEETAHLKGTIDALSNYVAHQSRCYGYDPKQPCTCGLMSLLGHRHK